MIAHPLTTKLAILLSELESNRLEVGLVPLNPRLRNYNEGGMKRAVFSKNPNWYSRLCNRHLSSRIRNHKKPDTKIKRADTLRILGRLAAGLQSRSKYAEELREIAQRT